MKRTLKQSKTIMARILGQVLPTGVIILVSEDPFLIKARIEGHVSQPVPKLCQTCAIKAPIDERDQLINTRLAKKVAYYLVGDIGVIGYVSKNALGSIFNKYKYVIKSYNAEMALSFVSV